MVRQINAAGRDAIKRFEACKLEAYQDAGGVWTIGWGSTRHVHAGLRITPDEAEQRFEADLAPAETAVSQLVKVALNDNQFAALVSFTFNCGAGTLRTSTLLRLLNGGDYAAVPAELKRFRFAHGKPLKGLAERRAAEGKLWLAAPAAASPAAEPIPETPARRLPSSTPAGEQQATAISNEGKPMGALTAFSSLFSLVSTFGPLIPEVVAEVPDIAAKAGKLATDVKALNPTATIADLEGLVADAAVPFQIITKTVEASKTLTAA